MNRSTPGLPVHHQLPEFTETHVHRVSDAIQPSHSLSSPSPLAPNPSQHQSLFEWVNSSHEVAKVLVNTISQQPKRWLYTWTSPNGHTKIRLCSWQLKMEKLYTVSKSRLGADCGSDHELLIAKFRLKLKKVGKTTRSFRYDLNKIPYDYIVEVTNRFKGLDLLDRVPKELCTEVCNIVQEMVAKTIPKKKKWKKAKFLKRWEYQTTLPVS